MRSMTCATDSTSGSGTRRNRHCRASFTRTRRERRVDARREADRIFVVPQIRRASTGRPPMGPAWPFSGPLGVQRTAVARHSIPTSRPQSIRHPHYRRQARDHAHQQPRTRPTPTCHLTASGSHAHERSGRDEITCTPSVSRRRALADIDQTEARPVWARNGRAVLLMESSVSFGFKPPRALPPAVPRSCSTCRAPTVPRAPTMWRQMVAFS